MWCWVIVDLNKKFNMLYNILKEWLKRNEKDMRILDLKYVQEI